MRIQKPYAGGRVSVPGRPVKVDHYGEVRKKKTLSVPMDEEMIYWLTRLAELNDSKDREDNTINRIIRAAVYIHLKRYLPDHFRMTEEHFLKSNARTGKVYNGERF